MKTQIRVMQVWLGFAVLASWTCAQADDLDLANSPLFLGTSVDANVFFEIDDSGSMDWETLTNEFDYYTTYWNGANESKIDNGMWRSFADDDNPANTSFTGRRDYGYMFAESDRLYQSSGSFGANAEQNPEALERDWRARSSDFNLVYYDPSVTYEPWVGMSDASFSAARSDPQSGSDGYDDLRDLEGFVFEVWEDDHGYEDSRPDGPDSATDTSNGIVDLWDSRTKYTVNDTTITVTEYSVPDAATMDGLNQDCDLGDAQDTVPYEDCFGTTATTTTIDLNGGELTPWGRTVTQEQQNIANWYSYYRKRSYVAKAAIAAVVEKANDFRYGMSLINNDDDLFIKVPAAGVTDYSSHNTSMLSALYSYNWGADGTPLRTGLQNVGEYFDGDVGDTDPIISECQQNFTILLTDGYWSNDPDPSSIDDEDGDGRYETLADVAKFYYDKDLDTTLANNVPTSLKDDNNKQHMVTFGVAFGVKGDLVDTDDDGFPNPELEEDDTWGEDPFNNDPGKIDDLWHAAFNSAGEFVSAQTPAAVVDSLTEALSEISDRVGSSASTAVNSGSLNEGSHLFQARFDSGGWSGELKAFAIESDGTIDPDEDWEASEVLDTQHYNFDRVILTFNPDIDSPAGGDVEGEGVAFRFPADYTAPNATTDMNDEQVAALLKYAPNDISGTLNATEVAQNQAYGEAFLNYLRGDRSNEGAGYDFRDRNSALGDIVDSDPKYVGAPRERYPDSLETAPYSTFKTTYADRDPVVYVGANDGMVHGFAEEDGSEVLAYVPTKVYENLPELGEDSYIHRYFINEAPAAVDAYFSDAAAWRTVLVGGLGRGGQGLYALDVTNPDTFSEANADDIVLWEFTDEDDADLGYTYGTVSVGKMHDGTWAAIFGNGYNNTEADGAASSTGRAALYIVDIETGELLKKIDTEAGSAATPNGLASPLLVDVDQDHLVDYIYAGDLQGNLWKFDVTSSNKTQWDTTWTSGGDPQPLFTTETGQPITTRPLVALHPEGLDGYMVYFGTGKYLESNDNNSTGDTQAFYGIWDKDETNLTEFDSSDLLQQFITDQYVDGFDTDDDDVDDKFNTVRTFTNTTIDFSTHMGWFVELKPQKVGGVANNDNFGEKVPFNAQLRSGRVIFTSLVPSSNNCDFGGTSFQFQLDYANGGQLPFPPFDLTGDDVFDSEDTYVGAVQSEIGIVPTPSVILDGDSEIAFSSGSSGDVDTLRLNTGANTLGRQSWRQVK